MERHDCSRRRKQRRRRRRSSLPGETGGRRKLAADQCDQSYLMGGLDAAERRQFTMRYTASGLMLNFVACCFWAWVFRLWRRQRRPSFLRSAGHAFGISALAYVTDYYLVPRRFTPGFELCLSQRSFPWIYGALAVGLLVPDAFTYMRQRWHSVPNLRTHYSLKEDKWQQGSSGRRRAATSKRLRAPRNESGRSRIYRNAQGPRWESREPRRRGGSDEPPEERRLNGSYSPRTGM